MIKVTFNCAKHHIEDLDSALSELGAVSIVINPADEEEIFEPELGTQPLWENCNLSAFFNPDETGRDFVETECNALAEDMNVPFEMIFEVEQDWSTTWQRDFTTMRFGQRLIIHPSFDTPEKIDQFAILLDPGLAFGTGKHPTTALCLEWLDSNIHGGESVIDYGCGSGILAIAASKLGAKEVIATDIDPQALTATIDNCTKNSIKSMQIVSTTDCPKAPVDIIIANILANPLISLTEQLAIRVRPGGKIALSGILQTQADEVIAAYQLYFDIKQIGQKEDWVILAGIKH